MLYSISRKGVFKDARKDSQKESYQRFFALPHSPRGWALERHFLSKVKGKPRAPIDKQPGSFLSGLVDSEVRAFLKLMP